MLKTLKFIPLLNAFPRWQTSEGGRQPERKGKTYLLSFHKLFSLCSFSFFVTAILWMMSIVIYLIELHQLYLHAKNILQQHNLFFCTISIKACFSISSISIKTHHELLLRRRWRIRAISLGCCCCCCCCYGPGGGD